MNPIAGPAQRRQSRFLDLLRTLTNTPGSSRVGFQAVSERPKRRVGIVASFGRLDPKAIAAAIEAGADAVEVQVSGAQDLGALAGLSERLGVPVGVAVGSGAEPGLAEAAVDAHADWLRLTLQDSLRVISWERPARILTIPSDLDLRLAGAINGLEIDAVQIDAVPRADAETTFGEGLRLRSLRELIRKPFLVHVSVGLIPDLAPCYEQLGVDALVIPAGKAQSLDLLAAYASAVQRAGSVSHT